MAGCCDATRMTLLIAVYAGRLTNASDWLTMCASTKIVRMTAESRCTYEKRSVERNVRGQRNSATSNPRMIAPYQDHQPGFIDTLAFTRETRRNSDGLIAAINAPMMSTRVDVRQ